MAEAERPKRSIWWVPFVFMLGVLFIPALGALVLMSAMGQDEGIAKGTILELHLKGSIPEGPVDPFLSRFGGGGELSMWAIRQKLREAAKDENIAGLKLTIEPVAFGMGVVEELISEMDRFRESGKPVHAFLRSDLLEEKEYLLATGADRIWMLPGSGGLINGYAAEVLFWRGTLDKLHIEPEVIMFHEYKSAGEPYQNYEMSPYFEESISALLEDIEAEFVERVTDRRALTAADLRSLMSKGLLSAAELKSAGLIDELGYTDQINDVLKGAAGVDDYIRMDLAEYGTKPSQGIPDQSSAPDVAVVFASGAILASSGGDGGVFGGDANIFGPETAARLAKAIDNPQVKSIVFRIDSPGGSAVGSDMIWREMIRAKDMGKPVIVSMGSVAASGGYWVSMASNAIVAQPTTITGSIGVVFQKFNIEGFLEWIGANAETVTTAPNAQLFSLAAPLTDERREKVKEWMSQTYGEFTTKVSKGRNLPLERVQEIAKGRVWSGKDALERGLVDKLGGLDTAIALAKERASLPASASTRPFPAKKGVLEQLLEGDLTISSGVPGILGVAPSEGASPLGSEAEVQAFLRELARPEVRVAAPNIAIH